MKKLMISILLVGTAYVGFLIGSYDITLHTPKGSNVQKVLTEVKVKQSEKIKKIVKKVEKVKKIVKKQVKKNNVKALFANIKTKEVKQKVNFLKIATVIKDIESTNRKKVINRLGYAGYYQFGTQGLETLGYLKKGEYNRMKSLKIGQKKFIENYAVWTKGYSLEIFFENEQYKAFVANCQRNIKSFRKYGYIKKETTSKEIQGMLFAAHLKGLTATKKWLNGTLAKNDYCDANGVSIKHYYDIGIKI